MPRAHALCLWGTPGDFAAGLEAQRSREGSQAAEVLSVWALVLQEFGAELKPGKSFCISYVIIELRECLSPGE